MSKLSRRNFIKLASTSSGMLALGLSGSARAGKPAKVVVVGGGFGGATCAKYIRLLDPTIEVTLVERNEFYYACPGSNDVIADIHPMDSIKRDYKALSQEHGVKVIHASVASIDAENHKITADDGSTLSYDRLVVSPGISFRWDVLAGYDEAASKIIPHAWKAGEQTTMLRDQITSMKDGGLVVIAPPANPFRCPPGPYERASLIAYYLKHNKPKSKIMILDAKSKFSKQGLFTQGWESEYPGMIEWVSSANDGLIEEIDVSNKTAITTFSEIKADVLNVIPPQKAGYLAEQAGLTNSSGWCPVDQRTFESTIHPDVHVIGDASIAGAMPKSGYSANTQAKVCAHAVVQILNEKPVVTAGFLNTCYSFIGPHYGISVAAVYEYSEEKGEIVSTSSGVSPVDGNRPLEAVFAESWHKNIAQDIFG